MKKPITSVAFRADAPLEKFHPWCKTTGGETQTRYMNCREVSASDFGFLRLVPVLPENWPAGDLALFVRPEHVLWMIVADTPQTKLGFV